MAGAALNDESAALAVNTLKQAIDEYFKDISTKKNEQ